MPCGLNISIVGDNNLIIIEQPNFSKTSIDIVGDNNLFSVKKTLKKCCGAYFYLADGGYIEIDKNCEIGNGKLFVCVNGDYNKSHGLYIGEGTHIAREAIIRTSDGECLLDYNTERPISEPQNVHIGKHCWITSRCTILKGTYLPDNTVVAANSLVNKKFDTKGTLIGGVPAKILKNDIKWAAGSFKENMIKINGTPKREENRDFEQYLKDTFNINAKGNTSA